MAGAFTVSMGAEAMAAQLNQMRDELVARFRANEDEHEKLRNATETVKAEIADLGGKLSTVQLNLSSTADQARAVLETMIAEARKALGTVRGEGLMALQAAMAKHEADLRGLYTTLGDQVRQEFLGVRAELDATQAGLRQIGVAAAAAASSAQAALQYAGSPAAPGAVGSSPAAPSPFTTR